MASETTRVRSSRVSMADIAACARELAILIDAGVPLLRAIRTLATRSSNKTLGAAMQDVGQRVERGSSFAAALAAHPGIFDDLFVNIVKMGETGGTLETALQRLAAHYEREQDLLRRVRNAMLYPISAIITAIVVICIIVVLVVPRFKEFYSEQGVERLPWPTEMVALFGSVLVYGWWAILIVLGILYFSLKKYAATPTGRRKLDALKLNIPKLSGIYVKVLTTRLSTTLSTLIQNGIPLVHALRLTGETVGNTRVEEVCNSAAGRVESGESLTASLEEAKLFPPLFMDMVAVGEEAGSLDVALERVSRVYEQDTRSALDGIVTMIQPALVVVLGLAVILLAVAVLLPYFELQSVILGS